MHTETLDALGLRCPLPLLQTKLRLNDLQAGDELTIIASDPGSIRDIPAFAQQVGHQVLSVQEYDGRYEIILRK